jgi:hypothetical protein
MAFTYGCQHATKYPSATNDLHDDAIELLQLSISQNVLAQIQQASLQVIANFNTVKKADVSILDEFQSFAGKVKTQAERNLRIAAQLHTSRLAAYGFTAEATVRGYTEYAFNAQLDKRLCKVCRVMHGRIFKVADARTMLRRVLKTKDPAEITNIQPWPPIAKASDMVTMSANDLVQQGWHCPPMHPSCRCLIVPTTNVPSLEDTPSAIAAGLPTKKYVPKPNDFLATGLAATPDVLKAWGDSVDVSPMRFVSQLLGIDEGLVTHDLLTSKGIKLALNNRELTFKVNNLLFGSTKPVQYKGTLFLGEKSGVLEMLHVYEDDAELGKTIFGDAITAFKNAGAENVGVNANIGHGSFAMSKYGYVPRNEHEWLRLKNNWINKPWKKIKGDLPLFVQKTVDAILKSTDPFAIWELADIGYKVHGVPLGELLLKNTQWWGNLSLSDEHAMQRFNNYFAKG